jgi:Tol biopolymer transport system component
MMMGMKLSARLVTFAAVAAMLCVVAARTRLGPVAASDSENVTWGAIDPTWSPDSRQLAFSLFGSIWAVNAQGGEARQVTTSEGYHAHPAWSPKGSQIAFIRGNTPAGRIPQISGRLMLADVESGSERELNIPFRVSGSISWSPDGTRLVCPLAGAQGGAALHEVPVDGGPPRRIQEPSGGGPGTAWIETAWSPKGNEIYFSGQRRGAVQIWSTRPDGPPIVVQLPLTRYRPEDITFLHSMSVLPDASGLIYSAVMVNGKGDHELYRIPRTGGKPESVTNTPRDEFSPAVSPDGTRIAHVSNQMGNIDLFTMPVKGGEKKHVRLSALKFRRPSAQVRVRTLDEKGQPAPVRLYVRASDGKAYCPPGRPIFYYQLDPGQPREGFFLSSGDDTFPVPAGPLRLVALKGIEYEIAERTVEVAAGGPADVTIQMQRWTNWGQRGWYTGENHFHANYNGSYYQRPKESLHWLEAEDLNSANMIVANAAGAFIHDKEFFRGSVDPLSKERYVLYWGQEYRNSFPLGHMAFLNIKKQVPPSYTSVIGSDSPYDFPLNTMAALAARRQGGFVTYVHPMGAGRDVFDTNLGAKEMPVGAALDAVDAIDILPFGETSYELWYRFLNAGFHIKAGAGTDVFTNWRGINSIPGASREYVEVGSVMNWDRWVERLREGRNFVTNGPLLSFQMNGEPMGARIRVPRGQPYQARLKVEVTSRTPLRRVEIIQNGRVIEAADVGPGLREARLGKEVEVRESCWFAVRITGQPARGIAGGGSIPRAHSGPIYVEVDGQPTILSEDVELMIRWIDRLWALLEERNNFGPGDNRERARKMIADARSHFERKLGPAAQR